MAFITEPAEWFPLNYFMGGGVRRNSLQNWDSSQHEYNLFYGSPDTMTESWGHQFRPIPGHPMRSSPWTRVVMSTALVLPHTHWECASLTPLNADTAVCPVKQGPNGAEPSVMILYFCSFPLKDHNRRQHSSTSPRFSCSTGACPVVSFCKNKKPLSNLYVKMGLASGPRVANMSTLDAGWMQRGWWMVPAWPSWFKTTTHLQVRLY